MFQVIGEYVNNSLGLIGPMEHRIEDTNAGKQ